jgi:predicted transcriptional regulator of viral defense system
MVHEMNIKTLGRRTSRLFTSLHDQGVTVFNSKTAALIMGVSPSSAAVLLHAAGKRGLVTHVRRGLYNLVPFELGSTTFHLEERFLLVHESIGETPYFFSHASALEIHNLTTQPNYEIYVTSTTRRRPMNLGGSLTHFVWAPQERYFGFELKMVGKNQFMVSDLERTLVEGLTLPAYCGGLIEVAKAFFMAKSRLDSNKLIVYAKNMRKWAVLRRTGFLLEFFGLADQETLNNLSEALPAGYVNLDPDLPTEGVFNKKWGLRLNVTPDELTKAISH